MKIDQYTINRTGEEKVNMERYVDKDDGSDVSKADQAKFIYELPKWNDTRYHQDKRMCKKDVVVLRLL